MKEDLENTEPFPDGDDPAGESEARASSDRAGEQSGSAQAGGVEELARERDELRDRLLRKQAEFDNFRKRSERERSEFAQFASAELMRELLNVLDSFELAIKNDPDPDSESDRKGFRLIHKQLVDTLSRSGLEAIAAAGQRFDPNIHEAVTTQPAPDGVDDGTVLADLRTGYLLKGRLLRPSMVVVAKSASGD